MRLAAYFPRIVCSAKHSVGRKSGWRIVRSQTCFVSVSYSCIQFYINRAPRVAIGRSRHLLGCSKLLIVFLRKSINKDTSTHNFFCKWLWGSHLYLKIQCIHDFKHQKVQLEANKTSSEVWSNGNAPCETLPWRCGSLSMTELEWSSPDALMSGVYTPSCSSSPSAKVIFTPAPGGVFRPVLARTFFFSSAQSGVRASDLHSLQLRFCLHLLLVHNYCSAAVCSNCSFFWDWLEASDCDW